MAAHDLSFTNARNQKLYASCVLPKRQTDIKAAMVFCHGYAEHSHRKMPAFQQLADAGIAVYFYDVHGFGRSEPAEPSQRALIWSYTYLVDDLCQFAAVARTHHANSGLPQVPWLLAGFSLGGLTAALAALRKPQAWCGLVLVSACMWVRMTPLTRVQRLLGPLLNALIPTARIVQRLDPAADLNPDPEAVADYCSDPLVYRGATAVTTAFQMGEAIFALRAVRHQLELPLYALHCTDDHITPYKDLAAFVDATSTAPGDKLLRTVQGGYHDIWGGREAGQYVAEVAGWVLQRAKAAAAAS
uniref:Serine aminopeptidase S33 domain-containing protein n=1 Tax=Tetradesmus obliquus TaxID=3088 RepID=A0A383VAU1_TETOB|eukprot:jgi/Sobl393_1/11045/SZX62063.1